MITVQELTPAAAGAVCVLQLEGEGALAAAAKLTGRGELVAGEVFASVLRAQEEELDEALVVVRSSSLVELHLHGSPPLVQQLIEILVKHFGASLFEPLSTLEADAESRVARAPCAAAARILLDQARGALRTALTEISQLASDVALERLRLLLMRGENARFALRPAVVVLAGPVNAGKSTLFNLLAGEERALTSDLAGTTRDLVRARGQLGDWPVEWIDTAGERGLLGLSREEQVEREGQLLAEAVRRECDLCIWLAPSGAEEPHFAAGLRVTKIQSFADRGACAGEPAISVPDDPANAARVVLEQFEAALGLERPIWESGQPVPFTELQLEAIRGWIDMEDSRRGAALRAWLAEH